VEIIKKYFPSLSDLQSDQFSQLLPLYQDWNSKINVISRKDIDNLGLRHVLHSLAICRIVKFSPGAKVLDLGTGGGFPGIPLAIFFPETQFTLVDGTGKKIKVVQEVSNALGLTNVVAQQVRAEELKKVKFDFVVSRAVASLEKLLPWSRRLLSEAHQHTIPNGLICLKGGRVKEEIATIGKHEYAEIYPVSTFFEEPFFEEKCVVYVQG